VRVGRNPQKGAIMESKEQVEQVEHEKNLTGSVEFAGNLSAVKITGNTVQRNSKVLVEYET
jgi:hypothetical protein